MQVNPGPTSSSRLAWDGTTARVIDVHNHVAYGFAFEVTTAIATDAVFNLQFHEGTAADPCVPDVAQNVPGIMLCGDAATSTPATPATITIPANTPVGSICHAAPHCRNGRFISLASASGDTANVLVTATLHGPKR